MQLGLYTGSARAADLFGAFGRHKTWFGYPQVECKLRNGPQFGGGDVWREGVLGVQLGLHRQLHRQPEVKLKSHVRLIKSGHVRYGGDAPALLTC